METDPYEVGKNYGRKNVGTDRKPRYSTPTDALSGLEMVLGRMPTRAEGDRMREGFAEGVKMRPALPWTHRKLTGR